jgi:hypothetical protein
MNWSTGRRLFSQARKAALAFDDRGHQRAPFRVASTPMTSLLSP